MPKNLIVSLVAADDSAAALNANEATKAIDISNVEKATLVAVGAFGGGTLTWQISLDNVNWVSTGLTLAAAGKSDLTIPAKFVRGVLAGATAPAVICGAALRTLD